MSRAEGDERGASAQLGACACVSQIALRKLSEDLGIDCIDWRSDGVVH